MPSDNIKNKPIFPSNNEHGIPDLTYTPIETLPDKLLQYRKRFRHVAPETYGVHFFTYDALFNSVWNAHTKPLIYLKRFGVVLTPDFSLSADYPKAIQVFNVYRRQWCGTYWQSKGMSVIPTVGWGAPDSYDFCFLGIPEYSVVALSTLGTRRRKADFMHGFDAMFECIQPKAILCYGKPFSEMERVPIHVYETEYEIMDRKGKKS
jgi:hypothetical protein